MDVDGQDTGGRALDDIEVPEQVDAGLLGALVSVLAPRLFAVVVETVDPADIHIAAWGLQFHDQVVVIGADGQVAGSFSSLDRALWIFSYLDGALRIVWHSQPRIARPHQPRRRISRLRR